MKLNYGLIALLGAGAFFYFKKQAKKFTTNYSVTVADVGFDYQKTLSNFFTKLFFPVKLRIENPSDVNVSVQGIDFTLNQGTTVIAKGRINDTAVLSAKKATDVKFTIGVPITGAASIIKQLITRIQGGMQNTYTLTGEADLNVGSVKFNKSFSA